jgi:excisionase family DNA binding protein
LGLVKVGNLRLAIVSLASILAALSVPPLRRRLPGLRGCPAWLEILLWSAFAYACLVALDRVRTAQSIRLTQAAARATLSISGQYLDPVIRPSVGWLSAHEAPIVLLAAGALGISWLVVAVAAVAALRRTLQPQPRLADWWVVVQRPATAPPVRPFMAIASVSTGVFDARGAAAYLAVSRSSVYRLVRAGQLSCVRTHHGMRFNSGELAALQELRARQREIDHRSRSAA